MKRCAIYMRVSTIDQHPEIQLHDLHQLVQQRDYHIVHEYIDRISGTKAKRPGMPRAQSRGTAGRSISSGRRPM